MNYLCYNNMNLTKHVLSCEEKAHNEAQNCYSSLPCLSVISSLRF